MAQEVKRASARQTRIFSDACMHELHIANLEHHLIKAKNTPEELKEGHRFSLTCAKKYILFRGEGGG